VTEPKVACAQTWSVWGDYCFDLGRQEEAERAWAIARGIEQTGGKLWLGNGSALSLACMSPADREDQLVKKMRYLWTTSPPPGYRTVDTHHPVCPLDYPRLFSDRPDLLPAFWEALAEIGRRPA